jgi:endonuclease/exonuclease/phosphatase family metal-dependent hydrolase
MSSRPLIKISIYSGTLLAICLITFFSLIKKKPIPETTVRLMTLNIRFDNPADGENAWPNRIDMVTGILEDFRPDFAGLQEVLPHQMDDMAGKLPFYQSIFRTREINPAEGEASPIMYDADKWVLLNSGTFWLSDNPYESGSNTWGAACNRIATWGRFSLKAHKKTVFVLNTHFDHVSQTARENSAALILEKIFILSEGSPVVLMGDLNVEEDNPVYERIVKEPGMKDAYRIFYPKPTAKDFTFNAWQAGEGINRIDYIFTSENFRITNARVIKTMMYNRYPSDHFPVFVEAGF